MPRPKKLFKSLDDDIDVANIIDATVEVEKDSDEDSDILTETTLEEDDNLEVTGNDEDISVSVGNVRANRPPPKNWADGIKTKFNVGDIVCIKGTPNFAYKVLGPSYKNKMYCLKPSGSEKTLDMPEDKIKFAGSEVKWKDYWDTVNDPYRDWLKKQNEQKIKKAVTEVIPKTSKKRRTKK